MSITSYLTPIARREAWLRLSLILSHIEKSDDNKFLKLERKLAAELIKNWRDTYTDALKYIFSSIPASISQDAMKFIEDSLLDRLGAAFGSSKIIREQVSKYITEAYSEAKKQLVNNELSFPDKNAISVLSRHNCFWIGEHYGKHIGPKIAKLTQNALDNGLGRDALAENLRQELGYVAPEGYSYWDVVSSSALVRARSFGCISGMAEAGITEYEILAVGDERMCDICGNMHGRVFSVAESYEAVDKVLQINDPEKFKEAMPWHTESPRWKSNDELLQAGMNIPPYHARCRCTLVMADTHEANLPQVHEESVTGMIDVNRLPFLNKKKIDEVRQQNAIDAAKKGVVLVSRLAEKLEKQDLDAIIKLFQKAPENMRTMWNYYQQYVDVRAIDVDVDDSKYDPTPGKRGIYINIAADRKGDFVFARPYAITIHESAHAIDHAYTGYADAPNANNGKFHGVGISEIFKNGAFLKALRKDAENYENLLKRCIVKSGKAQGQPENKIKEALEDWRKLLIRELKKDYKEYNSSEFIDIWDSLLDGYICDERIFPIDKESAIGHGKKYWGKDESFLPSEAFANTTSATVTNPVGLKLIKKYFPLAHGVFEEMINYLAKTLPVNSTAVVNTNVGKPSTSESQKFLGGLFGKKPVNTNESKPVEVKKPKNLVQVEENLNADLTRQWENVVSSLDGKVSDVAEKLSESLGTGFFDKDNLQKYLTQAYELGKAPIKLNDVDKRNIDILAKHDIALIRRHYDKYIKPVVDEVISKGLGIADLRKVISDTKYLKEIVNFALSRVYSFASLSAMEEFGITDYEIRVNGDEINNPICASMNGKVFSVAETRKFLDEALKIEDAEKFDELLKSDMRLPPYHADCHCTIERAETKSERTEIKPVQEEIKPKPQEDTGTIRGVPIEYINKVRGHFGHQEPGQIAEKTIQRYYERVGIKISDDEARRIHFTIDRYTTKNGYKYVRQYLFAQLRGQKLSSQAQYELEKYFNPIQEYCKIAPTFNGTFWIYRGIPLENPNYPKGTEYAKELLKLKPGDVLDLEVISSFSSAYHVAQGFAEQNGIILHVKTDDLVNSTSIRAISTIQGEDEVLVNDLLWEVDKIVDERINEKSLLFYHYHIYLKRKQ